MIILAILYALIFSLLTNCIIFAGKSIALLIACAFAFGVLNLLAGLLSARTKSKRLKLLFHGNILLIAFCTAATLSLILHLAALIGVIKLEGGTFIFSLIWCIVCNILLFWNGMLSIYFTSVQLGIKWRVIGLICGLIPIVNLFVLGVMICLSCREYSFELKKERLNAERKDKAVCATKYPILLVHGVFFRDNKHLNYWGRVPSELIRNGATCYYGNHQSALAVKDSAKELADRIRQIVKETGCQKVNIIAHSKGGLDCRYAMEHYGVAELVASMTTVNTPHRGCAFADWLLKHASEAIKETVASYYNKAASLLGDSSPDFLAAVGDLRAEPCTEFDKSTPAPENVYCQSIGSVMSKARSGKFPLNLSYHFVRLFDGKNDGLVGKDSFKWGREHILIDLPVKRGVSHADMIDLNRENIKGFDVREFYVELVNGLKNKGF